jgi:serine-type D-Ala-D-Ala carboxypeptidase/endopeptidase
VLAGGRLDRNDPRQPDADTVFEIGSLTKAFTALLLADMVLRGEVGLDDLAAGRLPAGVALPEPLASSVTLADLATHTSGLPFMPPQGPPGNGVAYTAADLARDVAAWRPEAGRYGTWAYSNVGYWLLGEALAARAGQDITALVRDRILTPLGMSLTDFALSSRMKASFAPGHGGALQPAQTFADAPVYALMPAAGGLLSTVDDLVRLLDVALGLRPSPLSAALALTLDVRRPTGLPGHSQALGWSLIGDGPAQVIYRDGASFGHAGALAWSPARRTGVVLLANQLTGVDDIALHWLRPDIPLKQPAPAVHTEIRLETAVLARYVGRYAAEGEGVFTVALEGDHLTLQAPSGWGLPRLRLRPESRTGFFAAELPLRAAFQIGGDGRAGGVLIYPPRGQDGVQARRLP